MDEVVEWLIEELPGVYVKQIEIGDGIRASLRWNMTWQVKQFARIVRRDPSLWNGFDLIGYSQGALISRAYIERYNEPRVRNFFSWCGPQGGQFGVPLVDFPMIKPLNKRVSPLWYWENRPDWGRYSWNDYWKDPHKMETYLNKSTFLADVNNERKIKNPKYKNNIKSLENFILIYSTIDNVIIPRESSWFGFFDPEDPEHIQPLFESKLYKEDWLGLRYLYERGRLHFRRIVCTHLDVVHEICKPQVFDRHTLPFLKRSNNQTLRNQLSELEEIGLRDLTKEAIRDIRHAAVASMSGHQHNNNNNNNKEADGDSNAADKKMAVLTSSSSSSSSPWWPFSSHAAGIDNDGEGMGAGGEEQHAVEEGRNVRQLFRNPFSSSSPASSLPPQAGGSNDPVMRNQQYEQRRQTESAAAAVGTSPPPHGEVPIVKGVIGSHRIGSFFHRDSMATDDVACGEGAAAPAASGN
eukprot:jgi/Bigna1/77617/fgenesh1_pg.49_\